MVRATPADKAAGVSERDETDHGVAVSAWKRRYAPWPVDHDGTAAVEALAATADGVQLTGSAGGGEEVAALWWCQDLTRVRRVTRLPTKEGSS